MKTVKSLPLSLLLLVSLSLVTTSSLSVPVFADKSTPTGGHFIGNVTFALGSSLKASGKAAGLGNLPTNGFLTSSEVLVNYVCVNNGGNTAEGVSQIFQNQVGPLVTIAVRNGNIDFTVILDPPPDPSPSVVCPSSSWTVQPTLFTFFNAEVHIQQNGVDVLVAFGGTISGL
jgi:hypothetical protein